MSRTTVGVLRGGPSSEYEVSLATGASILKNLSEESYDTRDIFIDRTGQWHAHGIPVSQERAMHGIDVVFNSLHGEYGEDGTVQRILDTFAVPYTGSSAFGSALAYNKEHSARQASQLPNVKVPPYTVLHAAEVIESPIRAAGKVFTQFGPKYIIKPVRSGSSLGIKTANTVYELADTFNEIFDVYDTVLVQQYIRGREATCGVIENMRNEELYALPPIEIVYQGDDGIFDYKAKYDETLVDEICPGNFSTAEKELLQSTAQKIHKALGLRHYSRSDFIVAPSGIYFLEVNNLPGLSEKSLFPKALEAVGIKNKDFLSHLISLAIDNK